MPTGEIATVSNTPLDFKKPTQIGKRINDNHAQIKLGFGYDHNFVLDGEGIKKAAKVKEPKSGRTLEIITDQPGLQLYSCNFLNGKDIGKENTPYKYRTALCLETQQFPNSPNQNNFPSVILDTDKTYQHTCIHKFGVG